jgi:CubicO group peptidase (beta-lactamase class C family)
MTIGGWNVDPQGINNGGTQLYVTARTMAKLGLLYLNNGSWAGREILTKEYVAQASSPHATIETDLDYGYQWWIDTAQNIYSARGSEGQYIFVDPKDNVVVSIIARADEPNEDISEDIIQYVQESVIDGTGDGMLVYQIMTVTAGILCVTFIAFFFRRRSKGT